MSASDDDNASEPARIARQIEETRTHLTNTLTALEHKLSARQITNDVVDAMRDAVMGSGDGQKAMLALIRRNPVPAALIGVGLAWMVFGPAKRRPRRSPAPAATSSSSAETRFPIDPEAPARADGSGLGARVGRIQDRAGATMQEHPLAVGALGAVIGALIGAILPMGRRESEWLADTQSQLVGQAGDLGRDALERARAVAEQAGRAAVDVVERELGVDKPRSGRNGSQVH
jgi:hypothetical protein